MEIFISIIFLFILITMDIPIDLLFSLIPPIAAILSLIFINLTGLKKVIWISLIGIFPILLFFKETYVFLPLLLFISFVNNEKIPFYISILITLITSYTNYKTLTISLISILLAWFLRDKLSKERDILVLKDSIRENEILNLLIKNEERINSDNRMEIALLNERNKISRKLHDSIGHTISSTLLQIEALKTLSDNNLESYLNRMSDNLSVGMDEIRETLHEMHDSSFNLEKSIGEVILEYKKFYNISLVFQLSEEMAVELKKVFLNIIKESLNNVRKHSNANKVTIVLRELPNHYTLSIKDNGNNKDKESLSNNKGMGLIGMEETILSYGGYINYGIDEGFFIHITVPKKN